jgi:hypothetical protein
MRSVTEYLRRRRAAGRWHLRVVVGSGWRNRTYGLLVVAAFASLFAGCGGGSASTGATGESGTAPSTEFMEKGGTNGPATFGKVSDEHQREAASKVISENFEARADGHWAMQCRSLAAVLVEKAEAEARKAGVGRSCARGLRSAAEPLGRTKEVRANTLSGPIDVFRVKGTEGIALYHGTKETDYAIPMRDEGGQWKVASFVSIVVP